MAREYPVKKGIKLSKDYILEKTKEIAGDARIEGDHVITSIPGMKAIDFSTDGKVILAQTEADPSAKDVSNTISTFNKLIENLTGFSSKERKKKFSK